MKRKGIRFIAFILIFALLFTQVAFAAAQNDTEVSTTPTELNLPCKSAILIEETTGQVLYEKNADLRLPMASTTKIMTALVALENSELDDIIRLALKKLMR